MTRVTDSSGRAPRSRDASIEQIEQRAIEAIAVLRAAGRDELAAAIAALLERSSGS